MFYLLNDETNTSKINNTDGQGLFDSVTWYYEFSKQFQSGIIQIYHLAPAPKSGLRVTLTRTRIHKLQRTVEIQTTTTDVTAF